MYSGFMLKIRIELEGEPDVVQRLLKDPEALKALSRREAGVFDAWLREKEPEYHDGLVPIERLAIAVYIYKKLAEQFDAEIPEDHLLEGG